MESFICPLGHPKIMSGKHEGYCAEPKCKYGYAQKNRGMQLRKDTFYFGVPGYMISWNEERDEMAIQCKYCNKWHKIEGARKTYLRTAMHLSIVAIAGMP